MKILWRILLALLYIFVAVLTGIYFEELLILFVTTFKSGWVFSTLFIRLLIIILTVFAFREIFSLFNRTKNLKFRVIVIIGSVIGFGIGFGIVPIYNSDYGDYSDDEKLTNLDELYDHVGQSIDEDTKYRLVAFFTTSCPHCKAIARKLGANIKAGQKIPIDTYFPNGQESIDQFVLKNKVEGINTYTVTNSTLFHTVSNGYFPTIYLIDNKQNTIKHWSGDQMSFPDLDDLLELPIE